jgi:hypothetical protein
MSSLLFLISAAVSMGAVLMTDTHSVGPYRKATWPETRFACLDLTGAPQVDLQFQVRPDPFGEAVYERDWSAFAAARAFVQLVGERRAQEALDAAMGVNTVPAAPEVTTYGPGGSGSRACSFRVAERIKVMVSSGDRDDNAVVERFARALAESPAVAALSDVLSPTRES